MGHAKSLHPLLALQVLYRHRVEFTVVGGIAAALQGESLPMPGLQICHRRSVTNCRRLASALRELRARRRGADSNRLFRLNGRTLVVGDAFLFNTDAGPLDCVAAPAGTAGFEALVRDAMEIAFGDVRVFVASLADVLRIQRVS